VVLEATVYIAKHAGTGGAVDVKRGRGEKQGGVEVGVEER